MLRARRATFCSCSSSSRCCAVLMLQLSLDGGTSCVTCTVTSATRGGEPIGLRLGLLVLLRLVLGPLRCCCCGGGSCSHLPLLLLEGHLPEQRCC